MEGRDLLYCRFVASKKNEVLLPDLGSAKLASDQSVTFAPPSGSWTIWEHCCLPLPSELWKIQPPNLEKCNGTTVKLEFRTKTKLTSKRDGLTHSEQREETQYVCVLFQTRLTSIWSGLCCGLIYIELTISPRKCKPPEGVPVFFWSEAMERI